MPESTSLSLTRTLLLSLLAVCLKPLKEVRQSEPVWWIIWKTQCARSGMSRCSFFSWLGFRKQVAQRDLFSFCIPPLNLAVSVLRPLMYSYSRHKLFMWLFMLVCCHVLKAEVCREDCLLRMLVVLYQVYLNQPEDYTINCNEVVAHCTFWLVPAGKM